ncbi:MAG: ABC transporter ATP-binding protein [Acidimicrobiales bacterium]
MTAEQGQVLALLGPNGAGKTTTVETLEGYRAPDSGRVRVLGLDPGAERAALTPLIGVMLQRGGVYPAMNARQALGLFGRFYDNSAPVDEMLERVGLTGASATPWRNLSGGEQQRLSLALALVGRPRVAFLDEPTAGVDPQGRLAIRQVIRDLRQDGVCVVLTTHELEEAERLADQVVIIDHGQCLASGSPAELMASGRGSDIHFGAPPGVDMSGLAARLSADVVEERPGEYVAQVTASPAHVAALTAWLAENDLALADLRAGRQSLEDVFLRITAATSTAETDRVVRRRSRRQAKARGSRTDRAGM